MMNLSDYVLKFLISKKIKNVFLITGGAISFLVDSFSRTILYRKPQVISLEDSKKNIKAIIGLLDSAKSGKLMSIKK